MPSHTPEPWDLDELTIEEAEKLFAEPLPYPSHPENDDQVFCEDDLIAVYRRHHAADAAEVSRLRVLIDDMSEAMKQAMAKSAPYQELERRIDGACTLLEESGRPEEVEFAVAARAVLLSARGEA